MVPLKHRSTFCIVYIAFIYLAVLLLSSCSRGYRIGVSQCVGGPWRDKVNNEMISAQHLFDKDVRVDIVNADNDTKQQVRQIDSMIQAGVDLLVISPNEDVLLKISLERARQKGIPVILYDRKAEVTTRHLSVVIISTQESLWAFMRSLWFMLIWSGKASRRYWN